VTEPDRTVFVLTSTEEIASAVGTRGVLGNGRATCEICGDQRVSGTKVCWVREGPTIKGFFKIIKLRKLLYNAKSGWARDLLKLIFFRILTIIVGADVLGFQFVVLAGLQSRTWLNVDGRCFRNLCIELVFLFFQFLQGVEVPEEYSPSETITSSMSIQVHNI
jgi:hypothetical protein